MTPNANPDSAVVAVIESDMRTVRLTLAGAAVMDHWYGNRRFRPTFAEVRIDLAAGRVESVKIAGPAQTKTGKDHATTAGDWSWNQGYGDKPAVWPPKNVPAVALDAVDTALAARR